MATYRKDRFSVLRTSSTFLRQTNNVKAIIFFVLAMLLQLLLNFSPLLIGVLLLLQGQWLQAILVPIVMYIAIGLFLAFWPILALIGFVTVWIRDGFLPAVLTVAVYLGIAFVLLVAPEWLMWKANQAAEGCSESRGSSKGVWRVATCLQLGAIACVAQESDVSDGLTKLSERNDVLS